MKKKKIKIQLKDHNKQQQQQKINEEILIKAIEVGEQENQKLSKNSWQIEKNNIEIFNQSKLKFNESQIYNIFEQLSTMNYTIVECLESGGQASVFDGYFQNQQGLMDKCVFKIYYVGSDKEEVDNSLKSFEKEIEILKSFQKPINIVKIIDSFKIESFFILILEKCQYSLRHELKNLKKENIFPVDKLLQMIFDLLDGLIQLRAHNTLHLDIKPGNILIDKEGNYCYTDFGTSFNIKKNEEIYIEYYTKNFDAPEIKKDPKSIDFQSDVYSLGITLQKVIDTFIKVNQGYKQKQQMIIELIQNFENIVQNYMIKAQKNERSTIQKLHKQFLKSVKVEGQMQFLKKYILKINIIIELYPYDSNKDIPYFLSLKLFYNKKQLYLSKKYYHQLFNTIDNNKNITKNDIKRVIESLENPEQSLKVLMICLINTFLFKKEIPQVIHPDITKSLSNVGQCYFDLGDIQNSLKFYLESLQMSKQIFQENNYDISQSLYHIGQCYLLLGDYQNSFKYFQESLEILQQFFKEKHLDIAQSLCSLGRCYLYLGDFKNSFKYLQDSLEMKKQIVQQNQFEIAVSLNYLGEYLFYFGNKKKGLNYLLESLVLLKQIFKENHPQISRILHNIGMCIEELGDNQKCLKYLFKAHQMTKQIFKGNHNDIASSLNNIGAYYFKLGDHQKGIKYLLESLEMTKQIFQDKHPLKATNLYNLGRNYTELGENQIGLNYFLESLDMVKQIFHGNHSTIANILESVGEGYVNIGDNQKGLMYSLESLYMRKQIFQGNHYDILESLNNVRTCYKNIGKKEISLKYYLKSREMLEQIFQEKHPEIIKVCNDKGISYLDILLGKE